MLFSLFPDRLLILSLGVLLSSCGSEPTFRSISRMQLPQPRDTGNEQESSYLPPRQNDAQAAEKTAPYDQESTIATLPTAAEDAPVNDEDTLREVSESSDILPPPADSIFSPPRTDGEEAGEMPSRDDSGTEDFDPCTTPAHQGGPQRILIVDLKSGWFAGDGGNFFNQEIAAACPNGQASTIDYIHITRYLVETNRHAEQTGNFVVDCLQNSASRRWDESSQVGTEDVCEFLDFSTYAQIWLLSGDRMDPYDIVSESPLFQSLIDRTHARLAQGHLGLFIATGLANVSHANSFAKLALGRTTELVRANPDITPGLLPLPSLPRIFQTRPFTPHPDASEDGTFVASHPLFAGLGTLYDTSSNPFPSALEEAKNSISDLALLHFLDNPPECLSDILNSTANPDIQVLARDHCGNVTIGSARTQQMTVLIETNMSRFYGLNDPLDHITRIARFLNNGE